MELHKCPKCGGQVKLMAGTMAKLVNRAALRGKPLDEDCKKAKISSHEYGPDDNRKFCYGVCNGFPEELAEKYKKCKAHAYNALPPED